MAIGLEQWADGSAGIVAPDDRYQERCNCGDEGDVDARAVDRNQRDAGDQTN